MAGFRIDLQPPIVQAAFAVLPKAIPYRWMHYALQHLTQTDSPRDAYLSSMTMEVLWLNRWHLRHCFDHVGVELLDPDEPYVFTSLHFGHWGMYPASLYQQFGIPSQMVATGRNQDRSTPRGRFWYRYGHLRQYLSGFECCYSTDGVFALAARLREGRSLTVISDVREKGLIQREAAVDFLGGPFYLQRTVAALARRGRVRIVPYVGYYDESLHRHRVTWFAPQSPLRNDAATMQRIVATLEPTVMGKEAFYFNVMDALRRPLPQ